MVEYSADAPATFTLNNLCRLLVKESKVYHLKTGDGRDFCHAAVGAADGSVAALDKHWKRRIEALPVPNKLARVYYATELDQLVHDLHEAVNGLARRQVPKASE